MLSVALLLNHEEAESVAAALARVAMDNSLPEQEREVAAKALREIERARVIAAVRPPTSR